MNKLDPQTIDPAVFYPLHAACGKGDLATVRMLLAEGMNPNAQFRSFGGLTPLHFACNLYGTEARANQGFVRRDLRTIIELLIESGADLHAVDSMERSAVSLMQGYEWPALLPQQQVQAKQQRMTRFEKLFKGIEAPVAKRSSGAPRNWNPTKKGVPLKRGFEQRKTKTVRVSPTDERVVGVA